MMTRVAVAASMGLLVAFSAEALTVFSSPGRVRSVGGRGSCSPGARPSCWDGYLRPCVCTNAPTWADYVTNHYAAADAKLLVGRCMERPTIRRFLENHVDHVRARMFYDQFDNAWPEVDAYVNAQLKEEGSRCEATPAQLLALAGEVYRHKNLTVNGGDFPKDRERLSQLTGRFIEYCVGERSDRGWMFAQLNVSRVLGLREAYERIVDDLRLQSLADPWLMRIWRASVLWREAWRARQGKPAGEMSEENADEYSRKRKDAERLYAEAQGMTDAAYVSNYKMLCASLGDIDASTRWFNVCQRQCFDDMYAWDQYAYNLTRRWGGPAGAMEDLLDSALATGRYDTWVPAFYVIGRWQIYAKYEKKFAQLNADERAWAYEDARVRTNSLDVIRRYLDGDMLPSAPEPERLVATATFAAVALTCGDEALAERLVKRLPEDRLIMVLDEQAKRGTKVFSRLDELHWNNVDRWALERDKALPSGRLSFSPARGLVGITQTDGVVTNDFNLGVGDVDFTMTFDVSSISKDPEKRQDAFVALLLNGQELVRRNLSTGKTDGRIELKVRKGMAQAQQRDAVARLRYGLLEMKEYHNGKLVKSRSIDDDNKSESPSVPFGKGDLSLVLSQARLLGNIDFAFGDKADESPKSAVVPVTPNSSKVKMISIGL